MEKKRILIIDDKKNIRMILQDFLQSAGYEAITAADGEEGIRVFKNQSINMVLCDLKMEGIDGIDVVRAVRLENRTIPIILLTAYGSIPTAVDAIKAGANDYLTKPLDYNLLKAKIKQMLNDKNPCVQDSFDANLSQAERPVSEMIGESEVMRKVKAFIDTIAPSDSSVLIEGECGTGKELIAKSLHRRSTRHKNPFVVVDCSAIPEHLIESELFGYEKGAFTGASARKKGRFEQADRGSLFLDEIGELPLNSQAKLLRVLQEKQFVRIGGIEPIHVDFRLIAATNKNLRNEVNSKRFRSDLFYRLNVISIESPPLRERMDDLPLLINFYLKRICTENRLPLKEIDQRHMKKMLAYDWPGNVRELKNCIERLVLLDILPPEIDEQDTEDSSYKDKVTLADAERELVIEALEKFNGNITHAARDLGIGRKALYNRIKKYKLTVP